MVVTRSQNGDRPIPPTRVFDEPPASPSITTDSVAPSTVALSAPSFLPAVSSTATPSTAAPAVSFPLAGPSDAPLYRPMVAGRETGPRGTSVAHSDVSSRMRLAQIAADEQLTQLARAKLQIERKEIELQEAQVQRRLALDMEELSSQGSVRGANSVCAAEALDDWVNQTTVNVSERRDANYSRRDAEVSDTVNVNVTVSESERRDASAHYVRRENIPVHVSESERRDASAHYVRRDNIPVHVSESECRDASAHYVRRDNIPVHVSESERRDASAHYVRRDNIPVLVNDSERRDASAHYVRRDNIPVLVNDSERRDASAHYVRRDDVPVPVNVREHREECYGSRPACAPPLTQADAGPRMGYASYPTFPQVFPGEFPTFTGNDGAGVGWLQFRAAVTDAERMYGLTRYELITKLRRCIRGEASRNIDYLLLKDDADPYEVLSYLEMEYGCPEFFIDTALTRLHSLRALKAQASSKDISSFASTVCRVEHTLRTQDNDHGYLTNPIMMQDVVSKLGPDFTRPWFLYCDAHRHEGKARFSLLADFLKEQASITARNTVSVNNPYSALFKAAPPRQPTPARQPAPFRQPAPYRQPVQYRQPAPYHQSTQPRDFIAVAAEQVPRCRCCGGSHALTRCKKLLAMEVHQRWEWMKESNLCFRCLGEKHTQDQCKAPQCNLDGCTLPHHRLLHGKSRAPTAPPPLAPQTSGQTSAQPEPRSPHSTSSQSRRYRRRSRTGGATSRAPENQVPGVAPTSAPQPEQVNTACSSSLPNVLLKVCKVTLTGPSGSVDTYALLDEGSTITLIDEELAEEIGATGPQKPLRVRGLNATQGDSRSHLVTFSVQGTSNEKYRIEARTFSRLQLRKQSVPQEALNFPHLRGMDDLTYEDATPRLLIGMDQWPLMVSHDLRTGNRDQPAASLTPLGWIVHGLLPRRFLQSREDTVLHVHTTSESSCGSDLHLEALVRHHFAVDALGVAAFRKELPEHKRARELFEGSVRRVGGRFEVGLPWRREGQHMPENYQSALRRLRAIERKIDRDPVFGSAYEKQMDNLFTKGYAVPADGSEASHPRRWYLPHFAVHNPNKPRKLRVVFDAAATAGGISLNNCLLEGPDLLLSLPGVLFRFRELPIAVCADIEEMFLRIQIRPEDQPAQMFLWRGSDRSSPPRQFRMASMLFGATSSPFLAHSVRNRNAEDFAASHPLAHRAVTQSHYMDDFVDSFNSPEEAREVVDQLRHVHAQAGFSLRSWSSSDPAVLRDVPEELHARQPAMLPVGSSCDSKILGLLWDAARDQLAFSTSMCRVPTEVRAQARAPTKREALSAVMSIFDPLGLLSHFSITAKILLQDLWRMRLDWDEPLPEEEAATFGRWLRALDELDSLQITRCYDPTQGHRQLHVFCDASEVAYAAAAYWRVEHPDGSIAVTLAAAKSKVAPIKALSIPRLELQAAVIGTRLADMVQREHRWKPESVHYWTDSRTVLQWIAKDARRYSPFVAHRLGEIAEYTEAEAWRWVPTAMNVADDATRPNFSPGTSTNRWFVGPDFLRGPDSEWPAPIQPSEESAETYASHAVPISPYLPDISRISRYETLVRATAVVLAFLDRCRKRAQQVELRHIERAERLWVQQVQAESFATEIECLRHGSPISPSSRLFHLSPILEDGVLRLDGRISAATAPPAAKRPIVLDGRHLFTTLLVQREHEAAQHANNERVVNNLRQKYHILHLRPTVKRVARSCARCMVTRSMPRTPPIGDLPRARLDPFTRPFSNCGVDYFGPMVVTVGRRHEKRWGALFTCLTTRAVHLELVASLSADSAIMALRRMAARRGWPKTIYSDNGTNFRGADAELRAAYADWEPAFQDEALRHRTEWRFIPPGAPNQGGAWERLVRSVKTALKAVLHQQFPREELLQTLLAEAEHSVNSRPLTHVSVDLRDPEALTPNHFLLGSSEGLPSTGPCQPTDLRAWRRVQALADSFWRRWVQEYLPTLVPRSSSPSTERNLQVGDLVIVVDHSLPRNTWPRGRVVATFPGPDGAVRSASVQTKGGVFRRPATRLAVLNTETAQGANSPPSSN
ncbi:uncharacterized protein LOC125489920 [Plutella xylostella]|uniref:uncharacterized protein LOC125489920 n=1 Tax=Plutella xylostella TaxID=51655 RepID=UPI002032312D|nr:uncharacterized protein LOC125489920 [Plutella xylostella]